MNNKNYKAQALLRSLTFPSRVHRLVKSGFSVKESSNNHKLEVADLIWSTKYVFLKIPQLS